MFYRCFFVFFSFFPVRHKNTTQPFSGTAERIFMKLLPNDSGEIVVSNVVPPPGEWRMLMIFVIYAMTLDAITRGHHARRWRYNIMSARMDLI